MMVWDQFHIPTGNHFVPLWIKRKSPNSRGVPTEEKMYKNAFELDSIIYIYNKQSWLPEIYKES